MSVESLATELTGQSPPAALLTGWLAVLSTADDCLTDYSVDAVELLKAYAVAHWMTVRAGGQVTSESSPTGASRSYAKARTGGSHYLDTLRALPGGKCLIELIEPPTSFAKSIKPRCY